MDSTIFKKSIIFDMEDKSDLDKRMSLFSERKLDTYPITEIEIMLQEAETVFSQKSMRAADKAFRKILTYVAHCDGNQKRKQEIVALCGERLLEIRTQLGRDPMLSFLEMELKEETKEAISHIYGFEIQRPSERRRLVSVIADRNTVHSGGSPIVMDIPPEMDISPEMNKPKKELLPPPKRIPKNGPCPCGSGKKYKWCCGQDK